MRRTLASMTAVLAAALLVATASPALAQEGTSPARPWHYWIAPVILGAAVLLVVALGVGYYVRVMSGRTRH